MGIKEEDFLFVLVCEQSTMEAKRLVTKSCAKGISVKKRKNAEKGILEKYNELVKIFPLSTYDIIVGKAKSMSDLKDAFDFNWEKVNHEIL